jgi:hypothetical protein
MYQKQIRRLSEYEIPVALDLAWRVFSEYESPDYSDEGTEELRRCLHDEEYLYDLGFYKKLGFVPTEEEKTINGIRFTPMIYERKSNGSDL